jgi:hypothetical protein
MLSKQAIAVAPLSFNISVKFDNFELSTNSIEIVKPAVQVVTEYFQVHSVAQYYLCGKKLDKWSKRARNTLQRKYKCSYGLRF